VAIDSSLSAPATQELASLPAPDQSAMAHSDKLKCLIQQRVEAAGGLLPFVDYMNAALYEPGLGYYMAGAAKFGARGDFITAPEVSPLFGQALAVQVAEVLASTGGGVLELGAGSGKLALSIIQALAGQSEGSSESDSDWPHAGGMHYSILEPSAELAHRQQGLLRQELPPALFARVQWLDRLPEKFDGVILANEVMDALPVERFRISDRASSNVTGAQSAAESSDESRILRLCMNQQLQYDVQPADSRLEAAITRIEADVGYTLPADYESEYSALLGPWLTSLAECLNTGVLLLIDYGYPRAEYYATERHTGTLACYYQHRMHDNPGVLPGLQDITAHVDFTLVAETAIANDLELLGYTSQSAFLLDNRILEFSKARQTLQRREQDRLAVANEVKTLTMPGQMGERFQVMALGKHYDLPLAGFKTQDLSHRL